MSRLGSIMNGATKDFGSSNLSRNSVDGFVRSLPQT